MMSALKLPSWRRKASTQGWTCGFVDAQGKLLAQVPTIGGERIFDVAKRAGILVDSVCGGQGMCGRCSIELVDGRTEALDAELERMHIGGEHAGQRKLACLHKVASSLVCRVLKPNTKPADFVQCTLQRTEVISERMRRFHLLPDNAKPLGFRCGQHLYVQMADAQGQPILRPYSIVECANQHGDSATFSIAVRLSGGDKATWGPGSSFFAGLPANAKLAVSPPTGGLWPAAHSNRRCDVWLLAGGVGIVPLAALVPDLVADAQVGQVSLWHGVPDAAESAYFAARLAPFEPHPKYTAVVADPPSPGDARRTVERVLQQQWAARHSGSAHSLGQHLQVLACGRPDFVECVRAWLDAHGLKDRLQVEHV